MNVQSGVGVGGDVAGSTPARNSTRTSSQYVFGGDAPRGGGSSSVHSNPNPVSGRHGYGSRHKGIHNPVVHRPPSLSPPTPSSTPDSMTHSYASNSGGRMIGTGSAPSHLATKKRPAVTEYHSTVDSQPHRLFHEYPGAPGRRTHMFKGRVRLCFCTLKCVIFLVTKVHNRI